MATYVKLKVLEDFVKKAREAKDTELHLPYPVNLHVWCSTRTVKGTLVFLCTTSCNKDITVIQSRCTMTCIGEDELRDFIWNKFTTQDIQHLNEEQLQNIPFELMKEEPSVRDGGSCHSCGNLEKCDYSENEEFRTECIDKGLQHWISRKDNNVIGCWNCNKKKATEPTCGFPKDMGCILGRYRHWEAVKKQEEDNRRLYITALVVRAANSDKYMHRVEVKHLLQKRFLMKDISKDLDGSAIVNYINAWTSGLKFPEGEEPVLELLSSIGGCHSTVGRMRDTELLGRILTEECCRVTSGNKEYTYALIITGEMFDQEVKR